MFPAALLALCAQATPAGAATPAPDTTRFEVGVWAERRSDADSANLDRWGRDLVGELDRRLHEAGTGRTARWTGLRLATTLPLAGGDARHHPDLRERHLDLMWGVKRSDPLPQAREQAIRTWLSALGCPDDRTFRVGWDMVPSALRKAPAGERWEHLPTWSELPDSGGLEPVCAAAVATIPAGRGPRWNGPDLVGQILNQRLDVPATVRIEDALGRPVAEGRLEIWRSRAAPERPWAARLDSLPSVLVSDSNGRFPLRRLQDWFGPSPLHHAPSGSDALVRWRVSRGAWSEEGWLDAVEAASMPERAWRLPAGTSRAWGEARDRWPSTWLAAELDSTGRPVLGLSLPQADRWVVRVLADDGHEAARFQAVELPSGVQEWILPVHLPPGGYDVRMDAASERLRARIRVP